jgi:hypothetical protein
MANLRSDLPALLRAAGLTVVVVDGWQTRGRPASTGGFNPVGVLNHHTGSSAKGWTLAKELAYAKWMFLTGRSDLPAPLCHISLGRSGTVYLGAGGRANHAGKAKASGSVAAGDGNTLYVGVEWMLSGTEAIPAKMMTAGTILNAVLCEKVTGNSVKSISCHYQTSVTGKWDIGDPNGVSFNGKKVLDVTKFRAAVKVQRDRLYRSTPLTLTSRSATFKVATNNILSGSPKPRLTLRAAPGASVVGLQEADKPRVHSILKALPGSVHKRETDRVPDSTSFASFVLYRPGVWEHVSTEFFKAYTGKAHVSLTRHIAVTVLRHRGLDSEFAFISYHSVTSGKDRIRVMLRREGDAVVRRQIKRFRDAGIPVMVLTDQNRKRKVFLSAPSYVRHWLDAIYAWGSPSVGLRLNRHHTVKTRSDHDTLVAEFTATIK